MRSAAVIYLIWALFLIGMGVYTVRKITDKSDPNSLISNMEKLNETLNEDLQ